MLDNFETSMSSASIVKVDGGSLSVFIHVLYFIILPCLFSGFPPYIYGGTFQHQKIRGLGAAASLILSWSVLGYTVANACYVMPIWCCP